MKRILIIDDNDGIRELLSMALAAEGWDVCEAPDGTTGIERLGREEFSAVLSDLRMPGADGLAVLRFVRERRREIPVILASACWTDEERADAINLGALETLEKPFPLEFLRAAVRHAEERASAA